MFVANDGLHVYNNQAVVHGDIFAPGKRAEYQTDHRGRSRGARQERRSRARGLVGHGGAELLRPGRGGAQSTPTRSRACAKREQFLDITQKQEQGGEVAHADVVKAEIQLRTAAARRQEAQLAVEKSRIGLAVLLFPDFRQDFIGGRRPANQRSGAAPVRPGPGRWRRKNNPDIRAAQATVQQETLGIISGAQRLPSGALVRLFLRHQRQPVCDLQSQSPEQPRIRGAGAA